MAVFPNSPLNLSYRRASSFVLLFFSFDSPPWPPPLGFQLAGLWAGGESEHDMRSGNGLFWGGRNPFGDWAFSRGRGYRVNSNSMDPHSFEIYTWFFLRCLPLCFHSSCFVPRASFLVLHSSCLILWYHPTIRFFFTCPTPISV